MFKFLEKTNQEIFNRAWQHRIEQAAFAWDTERRGCMYRGPNGLKCSIGDQILDEEMPKVEEITAIRFQSYLGQAAAGARGRFLEALQRAHDGPAEDHHKHKVPLNKALDAWKDRQRAVAIEFGLSVPFGTTSNA
jgi:hypothetical protein